MESETGPQADPEFFLTTLALRCLGDQAGQAGQAAKLLWRHGGGGAELVVVVLEWWWCSEVVVAVAGDRSLGQASKWWVVVVLCWWWC